MLINLKLANNPRYKKYELFNILFNIYHSIFITIMTEIFLTFRFL